MKNIFSRSNASAKTSRTASKGGKLLWVYSTGIILSILAMVGMFNYDATQTIYGKVYASIANEQQVISQQIATYALEASTGKAAAFVQLRRYQSRFVNTLKLLRNGDSEQGFPALPLDMHVDLDNINSNWEQYNLSINTILEAREPIETVSQYVTLINESIPELLVLSVR